MHQSAVDFVNIVRVRKHNGRGLREPHPQKLKRALYACRTLGSRAPVQRVRGTPRAGGAGLGLFTHWRPLNRCCAHPSASRRPTGSSSRGSRLAPITRVAGFRRSKASAVCAAAPTTCSQLSSTSMSCFRPSVMSRKQDCKQRGALDASPVPAGGGRSRCVPLFHVWRRP
jgi:hypothetical protein